MDEIDNKIDILERYLQDAHIEDFDVWMEDVQWLIDQLKKCREENKMFRSVNVEFAEKWIERTKDACFEAGWEAILKRGEEDDSFDADRVLEDFKQAIYSAEVKP